MFTINNIQIKAPTEELLIDRFNVTDMERLANADMVGDLIAKKVKLTYRYKEISGEELDRILDAIWKTDKIFFPITYLYNGRVESMIAYTGNIPSSLHRAGRTSNWVWKGVAFSLIQK